MRKTRKFPLILLLLLPFAIPLGIGLVVYLEMAPQPLLDLAERLQPRRPTPETPAAQPTPVAPPAEEQGNLPSLDESDATVRSWAEGLSPHAAWRTWLSVDSLIRRFTAAVDNVAEGIDPASHFPFLAPRQEFRVTREGDRIHLDPRSYERYDTVASVVASVNASACAALYRRLHSLIQKAYEHLGYPQKNFDATLARAIGNLRATPVVESRIELRPKASRYAFADPKLEELSPAQKQLLRMGPKNQRAIQQKLAELAENLELRVEGREASASTR